MLDADEIFVRFFDRDLFGTESGNWICERNCRIRFSLQAVRLHETKACLVIPAINLHVISHRPELTLHSPHGEAHSMQRPPPR